MALGDLPNTGQHSKASIFTELDASSRVSPGIYSTNVGQHLGTLVGEGLEREEGLVISVFGRDGVVKALPEDYSEYYFLESEHINSSAGPIDANKPIITGDNGKISNSLLSLDGLEYIADFTPAVGDLATEYPDTTGVAFGSYWIISITPNTTFTWTVGDLFNKGKTADNGDFMLWGGGQSGTGEWGLISSNIDDSLYYRLDGSAPIENPFSGGGYVYNNMSDGLIDTDGVNLGQLNAKSPNAHTHPISDVDGLQPALDGKAPIVHTHIATEVFFDDIPTPLWEAANVQIALQEAYDDIQLISGSIGFKGLWDATANVPDLLTIPKTHGEYWVVGIGGSTVLPQHPNVPAHELPWEQYDKVIYIEDVDGTGFGQLRSEGDFVLKAGDTMLGDLIGSNGLSYNTVTSNADAGNIGKELGAITNIPIDTLGLPTGFYPINSADAPIPENGMATVKSWSLTTSVQEYTSYVSGRMFKRKLTAAIEPWDEIFSSSTRTSAEANNILDLADNGGMLSTAIDLDTSDLNTITTAGEYIQSSDSNSTDPNNYPQNPTSSAARAGMLSVGKPSPEWTIQTYTFYLSALMATRESRDSGATWSAWNNMATTTDLAAYLPRDGSQPMTGQLKINALSTAGLPLISMINASATEVSVGVIETAYNNTGDNSTKMSIHCDTQGFIIRESGQSSLYNRLNRDGSSASTGDVTAFLGGVASNPAIAATGLTNAYDLIESLINKIEELETRLTNAGIA